MRVPRTLAFIVAAAHVRVSESPFSSYTETSMRAVRRTGCSSLLTGSARGQCLGASCHHRRFAGRRSFRANDRFAKRWACRVWPLESAGRRQALCVMSSADETSIPSRATDTDSGRGWVYVDIDAAGTDPRLLADLVMELGALSATIQQTGAKGTSNDVGPAEEEIFHKEPSGTNVWPVTTFRPPPPQPLWKSSTVRVLLPRDNPAAHVDLKDESVQFRVQELVLSLRYAIGLDALPAHEIGFLPERDWVTINAREWNTPVLIDSGKLCVLPVWYEHPSPAADEVTIRVDPGAAFGDGNHQTTRLCLTWLANHVRGGEHVLDYGCGTGVLAIAALRLGAASAVGVDIDPEALDCAQRNRSANQVAEDRFRVYHAEEYSTSPNEKFDLVLANILVEPLRLLAPLLADYTRPGGRIVLSGFVIGQASIIEECYGPYFELEGAFNDQDWLCISGTRKSS